MRKPVFVVVVFLAAAVSYSIVSGGATAADATNPFPLLQPIASDLHLAKMDGMMEMGGGMGGMSPPGSMPNADTSSGMPGPMAAPANAAPMGRMRGPMQGPPGMSGMAPASRLPGFPGASHLYHVGATGFFLDHPQHIALSVEQQTALNRIKEKALLDRSSSERRIEEAEQELWMLTAADMPDAVKIEAQVRAIEKLRGDQRLVFIRAIGEAGKLLTADQRAALLGTKPPAGSMPTGQPAQMAPMPRM